MMWRANFLCVTSSDGWGVQGNRMCVGRIEAETAVEARMRADTIRPGNWITEEVELDDDLDVQEKK